MAIEWYLINYKFVWLKASTLTIIPGLVNQTHYIYIYIYIYIIANCNQILQSDTSFSLNKIVTDFAYHTK